MNFRKFLIPLAAAIGFASSPASAALTLGSTACANTDISPTATSCVGWYEGNLNGGSPQKKADQAAALNALLGTSYTAATLPVLEIIGSLSGPTVDFATQLYGETVVSFHVGAANGQSSGVGYNATAFFVFDAGAGLDTFAFNRAGLSNARLYITQPPPAVPEPGTWAMLILGFGLVGAAMRRRRRDAATQEYAHA